MKKGINCVVLVGIGVVGCSYVYCMINQVVVEEFVLVDVNEVKVEGEVMDLSYVVLFVLVLIRVWKGSYEDCKDVDFVVIIVGLL